MELAEIMTKPPITVRDDVTADEVAARMISQRIGCLPVVDREGQLVGIVTPYDFGAKEGSCPFPPFCASGFPGDPAARHARYAPVEATAQSGVRGEGMPAADSARAAGAGTRHAQDASGWTSPRTVGAAWGRNGGGA